MIYAARKHIPAWYSAFSKHNSSCIQNESTCGADASVLHCLMRAYLHVHSHHLGVVITNTMLNNTVGVTDDRSTKVGH